MCISTPQQYAAATTASIPPNTMSCARAHSLPCAATRRAQPVFLMRSILYHKKDNYNWSPIDTLASNTTSLLPSSAFLS